MLKFFYRISTNGVLIHASVLSWVEKHRKPVCLQVPCKMLPSDTLELELLHHFIHNVDVPS